MNTFYKGMKLLEKAAYSTTCHSVWCTGPSIEYVEKITLVQTIVDRLICEYYQKKKSLEFPKVP